MTIYGRSNGNKLLLLQRYEHVALYMDLNRAIQADIDTGFEVIVSSALTKSDTRMTASVLKQDPNT